MLHTAGIHTQNSTVVYAGRVESTSTATSFNFNATAIGAAATVTQRTRTVLVFAAGTGTTVSGVTLGGVSMLPVVSAPGFAGGDLASFVLPWNNANTTENIVVNHVGSSARCTIMVFSMYGLSQPTTALSTFTAGNFTSGAQWDATLNVASGGVMIATVSTYGSGGPASGYTWSTFTEQDDVLLAGSHRSSAAYYTTTVTTPTTGFTFGATCSGTPGTSARCMNAVSFR